ncbi:MAG: Uma2 family endonuclease [Deltaproteobacteria bacterium]|nr:Uma2 family endonuclease [Deltaproteobacteria bacterium]
MSLQPKAYITPEDYLAIERQAEYKSEYFNGEMFAMAGVSERHATIIANTMYVFVGQLKGRPCKAYSNDLRVRVSPTGLYTYPDIVVVCGQAQFADDHKDTLLNPTLIVEVLSESTKDYDRGEKFEHYRSLASFNEYVLIAQERHHVEHCVRQPDNRWLLAETNRRADALQLSSISCTLALTEIYDKVEMAL